MSRILPLEKDVNLDKRYINESEKITENALENVINAGGGGDGQIIVSTGDWFNIRHDGANELTREECIELVGMNEDDFDRLFNDENYFPDMKAIFEAGFSTYKAFNKQFITGDMPNKIMAWCVPFSNNGEYNEMHSIAIELGSSGNYHVYGLGLGSPTS